ncbi:putative shikimate 5-dehydrogenase [Cadophora sp. DSE1049]|nr:putative shikimate 5-dehydrogenase [Cadophora sp. DSE1049]
MASIDPKPAGEGKQLLFVGTNLSHAVSNKIHDEVAASIGLNWHLLALDNPDLSNFVRLAHEPSFGGAIITIPHKINVIQHLDRMDDVGKLLGACNNVYKSSDGFLIGTNTDWIGIRDSLLALLREAASQSLVKPLVSGSVEAPGFIVGAGGAARAAVYALSNELNVTKIFVINRDVDEFNSLKRDITEGYRRKSLNVPVLIHLRSPAEAAAVESPFYGVGTVPDFEAVTQAEIEARDIFATLLQGARGLFLDMCYNPQQTRNLTLATKHGWVTGYGAQVVAWQLKAQWNLWAGEDYSRQIDVDYMGVRVREIAEGLA